jgi:DNA repair ATPase RecN
MAKLFKSRINKLNQIKKKFRVDNKKLLAYMDSALTAHELELILGSNDTIYLTEENIELIEKAMQKALAENQ